MIKTTLVNALNDSIDRLAAGSSIEACLSRYPVLRDELESLLETGQVVRRAQASPEEAGQARDRQQFRFEQVLNERRRTARPFPMQRFVGLIATLVLVLGLFAGGTLYAAESSLPGDALYGVKQFSEALRLSLVPGDAALEAAFAERRIDEARQIVRLRREVELTLAGVIDRVTPSTIVIEGLSITTSDLPQVEAHLQAGMRVEIDVQATAQGELRARQVRVLDAPEPPRQPTPAPTARESAPMMPSPAASETPELTHTSTPTITRPTVTTIAASTATRDSADGCQPARPSGWIAYTVQPGETLSDLAARTGGSMDAIAEANCLSGTRLIVAGQPLYLPRAPQRPPALSPTPEPQRASDSTPTQTANPRGSSDGGRDGTADRQQDRQSSTGSDSGSSDSGGRRGG